MNPFIFIIPSILGIIVFGCIYFLQDKCNRNNEEYNIGGVWNQDKYPNECEIFFLGFMISIVCFFTSLATAPMCES